MKIFSIIQTKREYATMTVLVGYPYVEKIQKVRSDRDKFFSYICGRGLFLLSTVMWNEKRFGREMCERQAN